VERRDLSRNGSRRLDRVTTAGRVSLVRATMRRRAAERAFEDYVREMARRWSPPPPDGRPGVSDLLPKV
jgi:hypothetical protein